jgi:predicted RNA-binding Zn ribbon-like protein
MLPSTTGAGAGTPRFDAGRPCLDLLATTHPAEHLLTPAALRDWITTTPLVPPGTPLSHVDATWLPPFRELRDCTALLIEAHLRAGGTRGGTPAEDPALARLNAHARPAPPAPHALRAPDGTLVRTLRTPPTCTALLAALARDAVDLLTDPAARAGLRRCEGDTCPLVYLDTSRGRRRRWCSSEMCGNRERVARHRRRAAALART